MNIARWFSWSREVERQRDELRQRVDDLESERKQLVDALARATGKQPVFDRPEPKPVSNVPSMAMGPSAIAARRELARREEEAQISERAANNGNSPAIPEIPTK